MNVLRIEVEHVSLAVAAEVVLTFQIGPVEVRDFGIAQERARATGQNDAAR